MLFSDRSRYPLKFLPILWLACFLIALAMLAVGLPKLGGVIFAVASVAELLTLIVLREPGEDDVP